MQHRKGFSRCSTIGAGARGLCDSFDGTAEKPCPDTNLVSNRNTIKKRAALAGDPV
jgi:hypothetical protein